MGRFETQSKSTEHKQEHNGWYTVSYLQEENEFEVMKIVTKNIYS